MNVFWTETAREHLLDIHDYIARHSQTYASRVVDRITARSKQIALFPESGRKVPEFNLPQVREVIEGPYRIVYHIRPDAVDVIAVLHGAQHSPWIQSE
jgi:toxin ParE1/3/4